MLVDIFSSFDDNNQTFMSWYVLTWVLSLVVIILVGCLYWISNSKCNSMFLVCMYAGSSQIFRSRGLTMGGFTQLVSGLFLLMILMNLSGLIPYVFSVTSHLVFSLSVALPMWLCLIISAVLYDPKSVVAGLLPMGAPMLLNPFLVIIETVSILVRPITLSVRLTANMSAGHIVLTLIGNYMTASLFSSGVICVVLFTLVQVFYTIFEFGISLVQAYIFCLLITLYSDEHPGI